MSLHLEIIERNHSPITMIPVALPHGILCALRVLFEQGGNHERVAVGGIGDYNDLALITVIHEGQRRGGTHAIASVAHAGGRDAAPKEKAGDIVANTCNLSYSLFSGCGAVYWCFPTCRHMAHVSEGYVNDLASFLLHKIFRCNHYQMLIKLHESLDIANERPDAAQPYKQEQQQYQCSENHGKGAKRIVVWNHDRCHEREQT